VLTQQDSTRQPQNKQNIWFGKFENLSDDNKTVKTGLPIKILQKK
jgi:hypothetical protein